jgi:hypothetical protein
MISDRQARAHKYRHSREISGTDVAEPTRAMACQRPSHDPRDERLERPATSTAEEPALAPVQLAPTRVPTSRLRDCVDCYGADYAAERDVGSATATQEDMWRV